MTCPVEQLKQDVVFVMSATQRYYGAMDRGELVAELLEAQRENQWLREEIDRLNMQLNGGNHVR